MKKHIGYTVEADMPLASAKMQFKGFITYFNGSDIVVTASPFFEEKVDAWKWIGYTLTEWEKE